MISVLINGVDRSQLITFGSLAIRDNINQQADTCEFSIKQHAGQTYKPNLDDEVEIYLDSDKIYGGVIVSIEQKVDYNHSVFINTIKCTDYTKYLNRKIVLKRYTNTTAKDVIVDLITNYASGFTTNNVGGEDVSIKTISFNELNVADCISKLATLTNYSWYVDYNKDVHFIKKNDEPAPFNLTEDTDNFIIESLSYSDDLSQIRNKIKIRGGEAAADARTEKKTGDGVTDTFPLANKFSEKPTVTVGGVSKTVGVDYLDKDTDFQVMWNYEQKYIRFTSGNIPPASTTPNIEITGKPIKPIVVQLYDSYSISKYGIYEFYIRNDNLTSREEAVKYAQSQLQAYSASIKSTKFDTYKAGLRSGQTIVINLPTRGIAESFIIQSVSFKQLTPEKGYWSVSLATLRTISLIDILQRLLTKEQLVSGEDETLLEFIQFLDNSTVTDSYRLSTTETENYLWCEEGTEVISSPTLIDSYSETNQNGSVQVYGSEAGQSFTPDNRYEVYKAKFYLKKTGSPTGNIYAKIYEVKSGQVGKLLATSDAVNVSTLTTSFALYDFIFNGNNRIVLENGFEYLVAISYSDGNASNNVVVGIETSGTGHSGKLWQKSGSTWSSSNQDACFYIYAGIVNPIVWDKFTWN